MEYLILAAIGLGMGLFGGMLGIGGSIVMIPAMVAVFGENQHLYQASAMLCNVVVAGSSLFAHRKAQVLVPGVIRRLIPLAVLGVVLGVWVSNTSLFAGERSYLLARILGGFLVYAAVYNGVKSFRKKSEGTSDVIGPVFIDGRDRVAAGVIGLVTGFFGGLLGMGGGSIATPLQQLFLRLPIRRAMSNSAATIVSLACIGSIYKNLSLAQHEIDFVLFSGQPGWMISLKVAGIIIPTALLGGFVGGHLMHIVPRKLVRGVFIGVLLLAAYKLFTVSP